MKKLSAISILVAILFSQFGLFIYYTIDLQQIRNESQKELIAGLPDRYFVTLNLEENQSLINWENEGVEFSLNGEMYDVAKIKNENGKTILYCMPDKKEEQLLNDFSKTIKEVNENNCSNKNQRIFKLNFPDLFFAGSMDKNDCSSLTVSPDFFAITPDILSSNKKIITPPPEHCV